jgi:hypothetical protein
MRITKCRRDEQEDGKNFMRKTKMHTNSEKKTLGKKLLGR